MKKEAKNSKSQEEVEAKVAPTEKTIEQPAVKAPVENKVEIKVSEGKVGLLLKEARLIKNMELKDIAQELCIRRIYLIAIEDSDYSNIPEYPYGIGFIRSYADYLGLDGLSIVQMYKDEAEADIRKKNPYYVVEPQVEATVPSKKYLMLSLLAIIAVYFAWTAYNSMSDEENNNATPAEEQTIVETESSTDATDFPLKVEDFSTTNEVVEAATVISDASPVAENPQVLVKEESYIPADTTTKEETPSKDETSSQNDKGLYIKAKKDTWIEVKNSQKLYISKVLMAGESYKIPDDSDLKISVGKAEGVDFLVDGKNVYSVSPNKKMNISVEEILASTRH